jgi:hypothetical protein
MERLQSESSSRSNGATTQVLQINPTRREGGTGMGTHTTGDTDEIVTITLSKAQALVLNDLLGTWGDRWVAGRLDLSCLPIQHDAEWYALRHVGGALESILVEPFMPDYDKHVDHARQELVEHYGTLERERNSPQRFWTCCKRAMSWRRSRSWLPTRLKRD